jgi:hypothetical protein
MSEKLKIFSEPPRFRVTKPKIAKNKMRKISLQFKVGGRLPPAVGLSPQLAKNQTKARQDHPPRKKYIFYFFYILRFRYYSSATRKSVPMEPYFL